jgi:cobalamin synthase
MLDDLGMLAAALPVAYAATAYTVAATAYLTGLRTNSYLFDPRVLGRFCLVIIPPLVALVILSFSYSSEPGAILLTWAACALLGMAAWLFYRGIDRRWKGASFLF